MQCQWRPAETKTGYSADSCPGIQVKPLQQDFSANVNDNDDDDVPTGIGKLRAIVKGFSQWNGYNNGNNFHSPRHSATPGPTTTPNFEPGGSHRVFWSVWLTSPWMCPSGYRNCWWQKVFCRVRFEFYWWWRLIEFNLSRISTGPGPGAIVSIEVHLSVRSFVCGSFFFKSFIWAGL